MIGTTQSAVFDIAVFQRGAAMRAVLTEESHLAELIPKQEQIFSEDFDGLRNVIKLLGGAHDDPVAAKPLAAWRSRPDVRDIGERDTLLFSLRVYFSH